MRPPISQVREILAYSVEANVSARVDLEDLAFSALTYELHEDSSLQVGGRVASCVLV